MDPRGTDRPLAGRVALVTGAAVRVGRGIALELARAGADLVVHHRSHVEEAAAVAGEIRALGGRALAHRADLTDEAEVLALFAATRDTFGRLDLLVNSAAVIERSGILDLTAAAWDRMLAVNLRAPFLCSREAAGLMGPGGGQIINILDVGARMAWAGHAHYCVAKAGLEMLTRVLALELAPAIRVNAVAPGTVMWSDRSDEPRRQEVVRRIPLGRIGAPEDIARTVLFLATGPDFITGQTIGVDGGRSIQSGEI